MFALIAIATLFAVWLWTRHRRMSLLKRCNIPGPPPNLIFGNSLEFASKGLMNCFSEWTKTHGNVVGFYLGGTYHVLVTDVELLRNVQVRDFHLFTQRNTMIKGGLHPTSLGRKMLIWAHEDFKNIRSSMSPAFSSKKLKTLVNTMREKIEQSADILYEASNEGKEEVQIYDHCKKLALAIISTCTFGLDFNKFKENSLLFHAFNGSVSPKFERNIFSLLNVFFPEFETVLHPVRTFWEAIKYKMHWAPEGVILDLVRDIYRGRKTSDVSIERADLMQMLIDSKFSTSLDSSRDFTDEEVISNTFLFLLAGYETTSTTLAYAAHNLINHPTIQEDIRTEVKKLLSKDYVLDYNTVHELPLLDAFIKETLRIYPPVAPFTARHISEDYEYGQFTIPKGSGIFVGVTQLHHDPNYWPEPMKFDPKRFLGVSNFEPMAYQPFGTGPRNCIGIRFAMLELKLSLASLLLRYKFELGPSSERGILETDGRFATLVPLNGVRLKMKKIDCSLN